MSNVMRSGNPVLSQGLGSAPALGQWSGAATMSVSGTAIKTLVLLGLVLLTGGYSFFRTLEAVRGSGGDIVESLQQVQLLAVGGMVGGLVTCLVMFFAPSTSPVAAPVYALCKGLALGLISGLAESRFQGIVAQAVLLSLAVLGLMLFLYTNGTLRATPALTKGIMVATLAVFAVFRNADPLHPRIRSHRHRILALCGRLGRLQLHPRLRLDRAGGPGRRPEVHGVVLRVRPPRHAAVVVCGNPQVAHETQQQP